MNLREVIKILVGIEKEYGDISVSYFDSESCDEELNVSRIEIITEKSENSISHILIS